MKRGWIRIDLNTNVSKHLTLIYPSHITMIQTVIFVQLNKVESIRWLEKLLDFQVNLIRTCAFFKRCTRTCTLQNVQMFHRDFYGRKL